MKRFVQKIYTLVLLFVFGVACSLSIAKPEKSLATISITKDDRILVLAPHPDDEVIGCGGIIQEAADIGAPLKVLYLTEGEHNPISLIAYRKKLLFKNKAKEFIQLGKIRREESIEATGILGTDRSQLVFLDFPDSGIRPVFIDHWGKGNEFKDSLTGLSRTSEGERKILTVPYMGEAILNDIKKVISDFKPTKIFCSHPLDQHSDHIGLYLFLKVALLELQGVAQPKIYLYIVHYHHWPSPLGFHPDKMLFAPVRLGNEGLKWLVFKLNPKQVEGKRQAIMKFQSQIKYSRNYLLSFVRSNELFSEDLENIYLGKGFNYILQGRANIKNTSFHYKDNRLNIDINFLKSIPNNSTRDGTLYLFGYQDKKLFKDMPKIKIGFRSNKWCLYNMEHKIGKQGSYFEFRQNASLHFSIPLLLLGNPDFIFYSLRSNLSGSQIERWSSWRVISLKR